MSSTTEPTTTDQIPISVQGADVLTPTTRAFYESTLAKSQLSLVYLGLALMFLGFTAISGMWSSHYSIVVHEGNIGITGGFESFVPPLDTLGKLYIAQMMPGAFTQTEVTGIGGLANTLANGWGFSTFCNFIAFLLSLSAAIIISPWITGTFQEKNILRSPKNFLSG